MMVPCREREEQVTAVFPLCNDADQA